MASVFETRDIERSLLNIFLKNKMVLKAYLDSAEEKWFTSVQRRFMLIKIDENFKQGKTILTQTLFEHEVGKSIEKNKRDSYITEWNIISKLKVKETPLSLIMKLKDADLALKVANICEKAVEHIEKGEVEIASSVLKQESFLLESKHSDKPFSILTNIKDRKELILKKRKDPAKYAGIKTGLGYFDYMTKGLFPAEMTLFAAITGVGKSSIMKTIEMNVIKQGKNCLHVTNEESQLQVETKFDTLFSGIPYLGFKEGNISDKDIEKWEEKVKQLKDPSMGKIVIKEIPPYATVIDVEKTFVELENLGIPIDVVIIDYMDHLMPVKKAWSETDEQGKIAEDCKGLAIQLYVPLVIATQAATVVEKKTERGKHFGRLSVYGAKRKVHVSNTFAGIMETGRMLEQKTKMNKKRDEDCDVKWRVDVEKNRDGASFSFDAVLRVDTLRVEELNKNELPQEDEEEKKAVTRKAVTTKSKD